RFDALHRQDLRLGELFGLFTVLAFLIASFGLFGLAAYAAEQRTKEVGIRKALGASVSSLVVLLSKDFVLLVGLAFVIAAPVAYFAMREWLDAFAYQIPLGPGLFLLAGAAALLIALATVSSQAARSALADPIDTLRYE
ncbi:MAG: FtsX-like permease family protein, partial [Bacteroidota bacterium]